MAFSASVEARLSRRDDGWKKAALVVGVLAALRYVVVFIRYDAYGIS